MDKNTKFNIISEGQKNGVSLTCEKYNISRTLYYRWLSKYKTFGVEGLETTQRCFTPKNKTAPDIESTVLSLIKKYPNYGPREIKYLLDDFGYKLSESATYNIMKRNNLNTKQKRRAYSSKKESISYKNYLPIEDFKSGECWLFWTTFYGDFEGLGKIYEYTLFDYKSRIACSRLYNKLSIDNFEDILNAIAIPVAQNLCIEPKYLCLFDDYKNIDKKTALNKTHSILKNNELDIDMFLLQDQDILIKANTLRQEYNHSCLSHLIPLIHKKIDFKDIKIHLQNYIRDYNIKNKQSYDNEFYSPVEYHINITKKDMILPLWAYMEREY